MRVSKSAAFVIGMALLFGVFVLALFAPAHSKDVPVEAVIHGIVWMTAGYIGLNVANNGVRGKTFNAELWDRENGGEAEK
jgi:hypothetical protein